MQALLIACHIIEHVVVSFTYETPLSQWGSGEELYSAELLWEGCRRLYIPDGWRLGCTVETFKVLTLFYCMRSPVFQRATATATLLTAGAVYHTDDDPPQNRDSSFIGVNNCHIAHLRGSFSIIIPDAVSCFGCHVCVAFSGHLHSWCLQRSTQTSGGEHWCILQASEEQPGETPCAVTTCSRSEFCSWSRETACPLNLRSLMQPGHKREIQMF